MAISTREEVLVGRDLAAASRQRWRRSLGPDIDGYGFILPAVIIMACLVVYPFFLAIWFSLSDAVIGEPGQWVGLENFMYLFGMMYDGHDLPWYLKFTGFSWDLTLADDIFLMTLRNTILFATVSVVLKGVFGLGAAMLMQRATRMKRFVRGSILVPFVAPTVLTTLGWWLIFDPTYSHINWLLENLWPLNLLGLGPFQWLGNPNLALSSVIMVNFWRGMPFFAVTIFAGLVAIPDQLYEAAETDGASTLRKFWHVTLPLLRPVMAVVILFSTIFTLADFGIVYVLTRGGPMNYTHLFATYSFTVGILNQEIGLGAAISLFLFPILLLVVVLQLKMVRKESGYGV